MSEERDLSDALQYPPTNESTSTKGALVPEPKQPKQSKRNKGTQLVYSRKHAKSIREKVVQGMQIWQDALEDWKEANSVGSNYDYPVKFEALFNDKKIGAQLSWIPAAYRNVVDNFSPMFGEYKERIKEELLNNVDRIGPMAAMQTVINKWNKLNDEKGRIKETDLDKALLVRVPDVVMRGTEQNRKRKAAESAIAKRARSRIIAATSSENFSSLLLENQMANKRMDEEIDKIFKRSAPENSVVNQRMQIEGPKEQTGEEQTGEDLKKALVQHPNTVSTLVPSNQINPQLGPWATKTPNLANAAPAISSVPDSGQMVVERAPPNNSQPMQSDKDSTPSGQLVTKSGGEENGERDVAMTSSQLVTTNQQRRVHYSNEFGLQETKGKGNNEKTVAKTSRQLVTTNQERKTEVFNNEEKAEKQIIIDPNRFRGEFGIGDLDEKLLEEMEDADLEQALVQSKKLPTNIGSGFLVGVKNDRGLEKSNRNREYTTTVTGLKTTKRRVQPYNNKPNNKSQIDQKTSTGGENITLRRDGLSTAAVLTQPGANSVAVVETTGKKATEQNITKGPGKKLINQEEVKSQQAAQNLLGKGKFDIESKYNQESSNSANQVGNEGDDENEGDSKDPNRFRGEPSFGLGDDRDMDTDEEMKDINKPFQTHPVIQEKEGPSAPSMTPQDIGANARPPTMSRFQPIQGSPGLPPDYKKIAQSQQTQAPSQEVTDPTLRYEMLEGGADEVYKLNNNPKSKEITNLTWQSFNNYDWDSNEEADNYLNIMRLLNEAARFSGELNGQSEENVLNELARKTELGLYDKGNTLATEDISETRQNITQYGAVGEESEAPFMPTVWPEGTIQTSDITTDWAIKTGDDVNDEFHNANLPCAALFNKNLKDFSLTDGSNITKPGRSGFSNFWWLEGMQHDQYITQTVD